MLGEAFTGEHHLRYPPSPFAFFFPSSKERRKAERRQMRSPTAASSDAARADRSALTCRRSTAALA
jgi:hypothetical protein